jgi:hypothetical protein
MLVIRNEQMEILAEPRLRAWIAGYLRKCYPAQIEAYGDENLSALIDLGIRWGRRFRVAEDAYIRKFVHVSFLLGPGFEKDPAFAWAARILNDDEQPDAGERICSLEDVVIERLRKGTLT